MDLSDILQLVAEYLAFFGTVFALSFAPASLWQFFKDLSDPGIKGD